MSSSDFFFCLSDIPKLKDMQFTVLEEEGHKNIYIWEAEYLINY